MPIIAVEFLDWLDPETLIKAVGLFGVFAVIFAESGLLIGFFLPGDSLLFTAGFFASGPESIPESLHLPFLPLLIGCLLAAVVGDQVGYVFGRKAGPALFRRPDSRFFKQEYVDRAHGYFDRYGPKTIVLARFIPIVRTFAPVVAGVGRMEYKIFLRFNVVGGVLWALGITTLGYYLGQIDFVARNLEVTLIIIVFISILPMILEIWRGRRQRAAGVKGSDEHDHQGTSAEGE